MGQPGNSLVNSVGFSSLWTYSFRNTNETNIINIIKIVLKVFLKTSFRNHLRFIENDFNIKATKKFYFRFYRRSRVSNRILQLKTAYWDRRVVLGTTDSKVWIHDFRDFFLVNWVLYRNVFTLPTKKNSLLRKFRKINLPDLGIREKKKTYFKIKYKMLHSKFLASFNRKNIMF